MNDERRARRAAVLVTDLDDGTTTLVREDAEIGGELGDAVRKAFRTGSSAAVDLDGRQLFLNAYLPPTAPGGHRRGPYQPGVGADGAHRRLSGRGHRPPYGVRDVLNGLPMSNSIADWPETVLKDRPLDAYCAVAAVTHDPKIDDFALKAALDAGCFYVGALGSRKTHAKRVERLLAMGATQEAVDRIAAPIGLDIGAASPAEIAVAVLAQVVRAFRSRGMPADGAKAPKGEAA